MGYIEDVNAMALDDDVKATLIAKHQEEIDPLRKDNQDARREARRVTVEAEVAELSDMGFKEIPGVLAYYRRVQLSDDEEPGAVLLTDAELNLSGDEASGARTREDVSVAGALKHFVGLIKTATDADGKLSGLFSDQSVAAEGGDKPANGDASDQATKDKEATERLGKVTGRTVERSGKRYAVSGGVV